MARGSTAGTLPTRPFDADAFALLASLPPEKAAQVRQLVRERDHLFLLYESLMEVERARTLEERLRIFVGAIRAIGFDRAVISLRDAAMEPALRVSAGLSEREEGALAAIPDTASDWRRRFDEMERSRISQSYFLDGRDEWVMREFSRAGDGAPGARGRVFGDMLVVPLRARDGELLAILMLAEPADGRRPSLGRVRTVELFGQQVAYHIEQDRLADLAGRRADRLQQLQQVGTALSRSLEEREILGELARGVARLLACDGVVIARPDLEHGTLHTLLRLVGGVEREAPARPLGVGAIAEVARTGQPVLIADYDPASSAMAADDDVVGDAGPAGSVLAVPLLVGIHLAGVLAVHHSARGAYGVEDADLLQTMGSQAASALSNAQLFAASQRERRQTEALADVARAVSESLRMGEVMRLILRHAASLLRCEAACIALRRDDYLHVVAAIGSAEVLAGIHLPINASVAGRAVREGAPVISNAVGAEPDVHRPALRLVDIEKIIIVPLITSAGAIGEITVFNRPEEFTAEDARVLQRLADHVAVAIVNARLYEEVAEATREWMVAFNAVATGMVTLDETGRIVRYNARAVQLAASETKRELVGRRFYEAVLHEARDVGGGCPLDRALNDNAVGRETMRSAARGKLFDVVASPHPNGGAVVTFEDVTAVHALAERNRLIVETATDAILMLDPERRISFANPAAAELFARDPGVHGLSFAELVLPELAAEVEAYAARAVDGDAQRFECIVLRADGERRVVSVSLAPLRDIGQVTGIVAALRDMTEERRARDAVVQSEARYRNLFETASDAIYTLDARGAFTSVNQATCELFGRRRDELLGRPLGDLIDGAEQVAASARLLEVLAGRPSRFETTFVRATGELRRMSITTTPISHGRAVIGALGIARDVTSERDRADALRRSEARYTNLVESASDAIFTLDEGGRFTSVNRSLERATGRTREALLGEHFTTLVDPRDRQAMLELFVETLHGRRVRQEMRYLDGNGAARAASILASPVLVNGEVTGSLGVVRDVSEEKALVEQLLQQEKLAAIGQLVSGISHELNNPLASVIAFAQLLLGTASDADPEQRSALQTIHDEGRRAAKIVSNLLTFARQHPPERSMTSVQEVLLSTLELRRYALTVHGVQIEERLAGDLPTTWADPFQLQQVFLALLANAEQALQGWSGERRITIESRLAGGTIVVSVRDSGAGVSPETVDRIFNPFYTTKGVGKGTGLGLSIADGIVREHGGRIRVDSQPGAGATFIVELPHTAPPGAVEPEAAPAAEPQMSGPFSVLIVDDEPAIRSALTRYLAGLGHRVDAVGSGIEALSRMDGQRYDVVLLDLRMPDMPGDVLYGRMLAEHPEQAARTVFLTGDQQSESARDFLVASGRPSLGKPFLFEELTALLVAGVVR